MEKVFTIHWQHHPSGKQGVRDHVFMSEQEMRAAMNHWNALGSQGGGGHFWHYWYEGKWCYENPRFNPPQ